MLPALAEFVLFQDYAKSGNCSSRIFKFDAGQCHFSDSWISVVAVKVLLRWNSSSHESGQPWGNP